MALLVVLLGLVGALATLFACWRLLAALRRGAPRELVLGWAAVMVGCGLVTMLGARLLGS